MPIYLPDLLVFQWIDSLLMHNMITFPRIRLMTICLSVFFLIPIVQNASLNTFASLHKDSHSRGLAKIDI
jgi:hypothetical protein